MSSLATQASAILPYSFLPISRFRSVADQLECASNNQGRIGGSSLPSVPSRGTGAGCWA